jgi:hypothetical protein
MAGNGEERKLCRRKEKIDYKDIELVGESNDEFFGSDEPVIRLESNQSSGEESPSEEQLLKMEEQVEIARKAEDRLRRKEKFKRLSLEKLQVDMSIKNLQQQRLNGKLSGKKINTSSLRGMQDVVEKVDRMMNDKLKFDSSSSSSEGDSDVSLSSGEEKISKRKKSRRKKRKETNTKHKSGKDRTPTSYVKFIHLFNLFWFTNSQKTRFQDPKLKEVM